MIDLLTSFIDPALLEAVCGYAVASVGAGLALSAIPGAVGYAVYFIVSVSKEAS